jgi:hypothetical protein
VFYTTDPPAVRGGEPGPIRVEGGVQASDLGDFSADHPGYGDLCFIASYC